MIATDVEMWALDRAIDLIAVAHGRPYAEAVKDIALSLLLAHAEGMRDAFKQAGTDLEREAS